MDDMDFSTLATRISAGLDGVRACLILSSDGLTLGVYPESGEERARHAWDRLQEIGDPQRGFVDMGEEMWVVVRRGPYAGVLVTAPTVRPGLVIDKLEFLLRAAEEVRAREASDLSSPSPRPEATRRPRTSLHGEPKAAPATAASTPAPAPAPAAAPAPQQGAFRARAERSPNYTPPPALQGAAKRVIDVTAGEGAEQDADPPVLEAPAAPLEEVATAATAPASSVEAPADPSPRPAPAHRPPDAEVDRVALAREFGRLLAEGG